MPIYMRRATIALATVLWSGSAAADPVTLADALGRGGASPRIAAAQAQFDAAQARARQAGVSPNPEVGLTFENIGGTGPFRGFESSETTLEVSQRLEAGGKRSARVRVARGEIEVARIALARVRADVARDVREAHASLAAADARLRLADEALERARELVRTTGLLVDAGRDPPLRKLRADALLAEAVAARAAAEGELGSARRALAALTDLDGEDLSAVETVPEPAPAVAADEPSLEEQLALAERDAARARIDLARSETAPDPVLGGGVRRLAETNDTAFVARLAIPIPVRSRNSGGIAAARADSLAAEANVVQARRDALRARRDAAARLTAAEARLATLSGAGQAQAEEALRIARLGYQAGRFSLVELIDAQNAYASARAALIDARLDRARAVAALLRATASGGN